MRHSRPSRRLTLLAAGLLLAGCGGGPDMGSLSPADFFARFSGEWRTDSEAVDRAREMLRSRDRDPSPLILPGQSGGMAGGRSGGGRPRVDPSTRRLAMQMATTFPERLTLLVRDTAVTVVGLHRSALVLPFGEDVKLRLGAAELRARAKWDGSVLVVERRVGLAAVVDRFEPVGHGHQLILTRELQLGRVDGARADLAYRRP